MKKVQNYHFIRSDWLRLWDYYDELNTCPQRTSPPVAGGERVRVVLRCRPISSGETKEGRRLVVQVDEAARQVVLHAARAGDVENRAFSFDAAFGSESSQQKVRLNK